MNQTVIAEHANVAQPDVANFIAGQSDPERMKFVTPEKRERIAQALKLTKAELVRRHLLSGKTITPLESLRLYGLHALEQTISRLKKTMDIRNIVPEKERTLRYAVYQYFPNTGDQK